MKSLLSITVFVAALFLVPVAFAGSPATAGTTLQVGSTGVAVTKLQQSLHIKADGVFGPTTQSAVMGLQAEYGLPTDGVVGASTRQALAEGSNIDSILSSFDPRTVAAAKRTGWAIELHLNGDAGSTRVLHYAAGAWSLPVASPSSSAGWAYNQDGVLTHYTTCTGVHYLYRRDPLGYYAYSIPYHHAPMAWAHYWCGGIAFHQDALVPSHGCVHLPSYEDAHFIWNLPEGTEVVSIG